MRLTKEQIEQSQLGVLYMVPSVISDNLCHILAALAAYERVVSVVEHYRKLLPHEMPSASLVVDDFARALDGAVLSALDTTPEVDHG